MADTRMICQTCNNEVYKDKESGQWLHFKALQHTPVPVEKVVQTIWLDSCFFINQPTSVLATTGRWPQELIAMHDILGCQFFVCDHSTATANLRKEVISAISAMGFPFNIPVYAKPIPFDRFISPVAMTLDDLSQYVQSIR